MAAGLYRVLIRRLWMSEQFFGEVERHETSAIRNRGVEESPFAQTDFNPLLPNKSCSRFGRFPNLHTSVQLLIWLSSRSSFCKWQARWWHMQRYADNSCTIYHKYDQWVMAMRQKKLWFSEYIEGNCLACWWAGVKHSEWACFNYWLFVLTHSKSKKIRNWQDKADLQAL